jgi:ATP-dependent Clp protease ATP-binding subunit ClpC
MFERFDELARRVIVLAHQAAQSLNHDHVGTEHLLLGTVDVDEIVIRVLESHGIGNDAVRQQIEGAVGVGAEPATGHIPFTPRAKKSLELALREANSLGHKEIRPVHMMLGILREREGIAVRALADLGLDIDELIANISDEYSRKYTKDQPSGPE